jgi:dihydrofolate synthase / folylpolyglutamate synthase
MNVLPVRTRLVRPPQDDLWDVLSGALAGVPEHAVVAVASKIVAIGEGRCVAQADVDDKDVLVRREADFYLERDETPGRYAMLTITRRQLVASAGIDASNAAGYYILWPADPVASARRIWRYLREHFGLERVGVVITDSHSIPMRRGVIGGALASWGFQPLRDYRGHLDLFGRSLRVSQSNLPDGLAAAAVVAMGEGSEQTPVALITGIPAIRFVARAPATGARHSSLHVTPEEDIYRPLLSSVPWKAGGGGSAGRATAAERHRE